MPSSVLTRAEGSRRVQPGVVPSPQVEVRQVSSLLWSPTALGRYGVAVGVGLLAITSSWFAIGGKADWEDQRPYMSLSIAVLVAVSFGGLSLLLVGRRRVGLRRIALLGDLPLAPAAAPAAAPATAVVSAASSEVLVGAPGLLRYHRADCQLAIGKGYAEAPLADHRDEGRLPCGVCLP